MYEVVVVGAGRLGLPLATLLALRGFRVLAVDVNEKLVETINSGKNPFRDEAGLDVISQLVQRGFLRATMSYNDIPRSPLAVFVAVSTCFDGRRISYDNVYSVIRLLAERVVRDTVVVLKTVVPIRATRRMYEDLLESGRRLALAFSVERGREGSMLRDLEEYPVIYGVADPRDEERVGDVLRRLGWKHVISVGSSDAAEFAKFASNTVLALMITYANILAEYAEHVGVDVWRIIDALNQGETHIPKIWRPGHYGGYCLTKDPAEFAYRAREAGAWLAYSFLSHIPILREHFVEYEADVIEKLLGGLEGKRILILGKAFKAGSTDTRYSPATLLAELLRRRGACVEQYDPHVDTQKPWKTHWDAIIVATPHPEFRDTEYYDNTKIIIDLFNIVERKKSRNIYVLGKPATQPLVQR